MTEIERILIERYGISRSEAAETLEEMRDRVVAGEDPQDVLQEVAGLEPDYFLDLFLEGI